MKTCKYTFMVMACLSALLPGRLSARPGNSGEVRVAEQSVYKVNDRLHVDMKLDLTDLTVKSGLAVDIIPVLTGENGETALLPKLLVTGRDRHILYRRLPKKETEGQLETRRHNRKEQTEDYAADIPYEPWMGLSSLAVILDLCGCGWEKTDSSRMDVADIRIGEPALAYIVPAKELKVRQKEGSAYLDFPVNETVIYPDYRDNRLELGKIQATIDSVRNNPYATILAVTIKGHASPEGRYADNARLAQGRAVALLDHVRGLYDFEGVDFTVSSEPEDWAGLDSLVHASSLKAKEEVLAVIRDTTVADPDIRNSRLQGLRGGTIYRELLRGYYPALRRSDYTVRYHIRNFTVEEAKELIFTDPRQLSLEEMYQVAQTYEPGTDEFNEVFEIAVRMYPDDPVSNLNAANTALRRKDTVAARRYLQKAQPGPEKELAEKALAELEEAHTEYAD